MTKTTLQATIFTLLMVTLVACTFTIDIDLPPNFSVSNAAYTTNHGNSQGVFEICSNLTTRLSYEFNYSGGNISWSEHINFYDIRGVFKGRFQPGNITLEQQTSNYVRVSFDIPPSFIPLADLDNQAISIKVGEAKLFLTFQGANKPFQLFSDSINVIDNCQ